MEDKESIFQYYSLVDREMPADLVESKGLTSHFNVLKRKNCMMTMPFTRKDYYKICLSAGNAILVTEKGEVKIDRPAIFFSNPGIKFGWKTLSDKQEGYVCIFNELYLNADLRKEYKLLYDRFRGCIYPFLFLEPAQYDLLTHYFKLMQNEYNDGFEYKHEIIKSILRLMIYTAIKVQATSLPAVHTPKSDRLVNEFMNLLEVQFPIDSPKNSIIYKTPADFANHLNTHVNHLNHCLKNYSGKSTTQVISERIVAEAIDLLRNSDWNITEIGNSLGFEYPQHFNLFFKKQTGKSPGFYKTERV